MVDRIRKRLPSKPVEQKYVVDFINKELVPQMERLRLFTDAMLSIFIQGSGSPEGVITAEVPSVYMRADGAPGSQIYVKQSGSGNTGWVAVL